MGRFLFAPLAASGHVNPGLPIVAELTRRGHEVRWYTSPRFAEKIREVGAQVVEYEKGEPLQEGRIDEQFPERVRLKGLAQMRYDMKCFIGLIPGQYHDLIEELAARPADILVGCTAAHACGLAASRSGTPWAAYGISVLLQSSRDTAPFGLGLPPSSSALGRLRNAALYWLVDQLIFKEPFTYYQQMVEGLGLGRPRYPMLEFARDANLFLQGCGPSFEYPRTDLAPNVHFVGTAIPPVPPDWKRPSWWDRLKSGKPVVLVTQGTIATNYDELLIPAIQALGGQEMVVVVTTGSRPVEELGSVSAPLNVILERFVPYAELLPHVSLLVTNGGYGTVQMALANGIPAVVFAGSEEKPEVAQRVQWCGTGLGYQIKQPRPQQIRKAVKTALAEPRFRARCKEIAAELKRYDTPRLCADLLETLLPDSKRAARSASGGTSGSR